MALVGLTGFETFSRVLLGWFGRMVTKDSVELKNQLVKARIPLLPEDYVASSAMQVVLTFLGGVAFSLVIVGVLVPQLETMQDPTKPEGENFAVSNIIQYALIGLLVFVLPALVALVQFLTPALLESSRGTNMDRQIPFAASYVSAMAAANATPSMTFKSLARNKAVSYTHLTLPTICSV